MITFLRLVSMTTTHTEIVYEDIIGKSNFLTILFVIPKLQETNKYRVQQIAIGTTFSNMFFYEMS